MDWFDIPVAQTPQAVMFEPETELRPEPEIVSYKPQPLDQELFDILMRQARDPFPAGTYETFNDNCMELMSDIDSVHLEEGLKEIKQEISFVQNGHPDQQQTEIMDTFGLDSMI